MNPTWPEAVGALLAPDNGISVICPLAVCEFCLARPQQPCREMLPPRYCMVRTVSVAAFIAYYGFAPNGPEDEYS